jgi:hypothetical protein
VAGAAALALGATGTTARADSRLAIGAGADTIVACAPSRPALSPSDTVTLRLFADPPIDRRGTVSWRVTAGRLLGTGPTVRWVLRDAGVGRYTAEARVLRGGRVVGGCSAEVVLTPPRDDLGGLLPAGVFLVSGGAREDPGYGAYTYLLIGAPPVDTARAARYRAAIVRFLQVAPDIASYDVRVPRARLNVNYLPVDVPLEWRRTPSLADSVLAHYQYATALTLLSSLDGSYQGGPYLVTVPAPLSTTKPDTSRLIVHNLGTIPSDLVAAWVDTYVAQAVQQRWSEPGAWERFPLVLRTAIGSVALGIPPVKAAMKDWSGWLASWSSNAK